MAHPSEAERDRYWETGAGHVCWFSVRSRAGCSHVVDQYEPPSHDEISGQVVPGDAPEDEEGRGVPLLVAAGQL